MEDFFSVEGKCVLVTGGSSGIGEMIVRGLAVAGAKVCVTSRKIDACEQLATELRDAGANVFALSADLSSEDGCRRLAREFSDREERLDILVNNAGATWGASLEEFDEAAWERVLALNVKAVFHLTKFLLPKLMAASTREDPARVINIGSIGGIVVSHFDNFSYTASKAAVHMLTRHLAKQFAPHVTVNAVAPGIVKSRMTKSILETQSDKFIAEIPMHRIGRDSDIVGSIIYLSSRAGSYITGAIIPIDGGAASLG